MNLDTVACQLGRASHLRDIEVLNVARRGSRPSRPDEIVLAVLVLHD